MITISRILEFVSLGHMWMSNINILFKINYENMGKLSAEVPGSVPFIKFFDKSSLLGELGQI